MKIETVQVLQMTETHVGTIPQGADIHRAIEAYCDAHGIQLAWFHCLGAVKAATVAFYTQDTHQYVEKSFQSSEILHAGGNISQKDGRAFAHIHMTLAGHDYAAVGGHLMPNKTQVFACEFTLQVFKTEHAFHRNEQDALTGLNLWQPCAL